MICPLCNGEEEGRGKVCGLYGPPCKLCFGSGTVTRKQAKEYREEKARFRHMEIRDRDDGIVYSSTFDTLNGNIMRYCASKDVRGQPIRSPSPEMLDISITDRCTMGCSYCYMDSEATGEHASPDLIDQILGGFTTAPYQVAIGGGEPTLHPDLEKIFRIVRSYGTMPNLTTCGINDGQPLSDKTLDLLNRYCGGVALTYHDARFPKLYERLESALTCQLHVHVVADCDVIGKLETLLQMSRIRKTPIRIILLGYMPMGRGTIDRLMSKQIYDEQLPRMLQGLSVAEVQVGFSEAMLPYFNSRPETEVGTTFAMPGEGRFSCFFNAEGHMYVSSFSSWKQGNVADKKSQQLWDELRNYESSPSGDSCPDCEMRERCATPSIWSYLICAKSGNNKRLEY